MSKILRPRQSTDYPDRDIDCEEALEPLLQSIMETALAHGWASDEARKALFRLIAADWRAATENAKMIADMALLRALTRAKS